MEKQAGAWEVDVGCAPIAGWDADGWRCWSPSETVTVHFRGYYPDGTWCDVSVYGVPRHDVHVAMPPHAGKFAAAATEPPGTRHQMQALADTTMVEFSTHDEPSDSIKLVRGDTV